MGLLKSAIGLFCEVLMLMLVARALLSWFVNPGSYGRPGTLQRIYGMLIQVTEPMVAPCRKLLSRFNSGPFDFSVLVAMLAIMLIRNLLLRIM